MSSQAADNARKKMEDISDKAAKHARAATNDLADDFSSLKAQLEDLTKSVAKMSAERVDGAARQIASTANAGYERAADTVVDAYSEAERFTAEKPAMALGMAAGLGLLAGMLLTRR